MVDGSSRQILALEAWVKVLEVELESLRDFIANLELWVEGHKAELMAG